MIDIDLLIEYLYWILFWRLLFDNIIYDISIRDINWLVVIDWSSITWFQLNGMAIGNSIWLGSID